MGLAIAIGLVIDNSVVVFEAVQRRLERGTEITEAVREGLRRTVRAMTAASLTTAVVFLPFQLVDFDSEQMRSMILVVSMAILLPLLASLGGAPARATSVGTGGGSRFVHSSRTASLKGRLGPAGCHTNLF